MTWWWGLQTPTTYQGNGRRYCKPCEVMWWGMPDSHCWWCGGLPTELDKFPVVTGTSYHAPEKGPYESPCYGVVYWEDGKRLDFQ